MSKLIKVVSLGALSTVIGTQVAVAQDDMFKRDRIVGAGERYLPEFEPRDVRAGTFKVNPELGVGVESNSNVYARKTTEESDIVVRVSPAVRIASDWSRHALGADVGLDHREYIDIGDESHTNYRGFLRGRIDVSREFNFTLNSGYQKLTERRGESGDNVTNRTEPADFDIASFGGAANFQRDSIRITAGADLRELTFDDIALVGGGTELRGFRDYKQVEFKGRAAYAVSPDVSVFVDALSYDREYDEGPNLTDFRTNNDVLRDAKGIRTTVGTNFQLSSLLRGEVSIGYLQEERDAIQFDDVESIVGKIDVQWLPTELTKISVGVDSYTADTGQIDIPSALVTSGELRVDHELKRNLLLNASTRYGIEEFDGTGSIVSYDQEFFDIGAGAVYKVNPTMHLDFNLRFNSRDSSVQNRGREYDQTIVGVGLKLFP